jgi:hypothetical protein
MGPTPVKDSNGDNIIIGGEYWFMTAYVFDVANSESFYTTPIEISSGDEIKGFIEQLASDPDEWGIVINNLTTGDARLLNWVPAASTPKYNYLILGAMEGYNQIGSALNSCEDFPGNDYFGDMNMYTTQVSQPTTSSWDSRNYIGSSLSFTVHGGGNTSGPRCGEQAVFEYVNVDSHSYPAIQTQWDKDYTGQ